MMEECVRALNKNGSPEEIVCKTLELNELKMTSQLRQLEALKTSLGAADEQVNLINLFLLNVSFVFIDGHVHSTCKNSPKYDFNTSLRSGS